MRLELSHHAKQRMRMRSITESDIRACLSNCFTRIVGRDGIVYLGDVEGRTLKVVTAEDRDSETEKFVITTAWRDDDS